MIKRARGKYKERQERNEESLRNAKLHRQQWTTYEVEFLTTLWDGTEETLEVIAEELGRTIEACRQRFYESMKGKSSVEVRVETTTTTTTVTYRGWMEGMGDE